MYFQNFLDVRGEWRWRLRAANHVTIATSGEGYVNYADCLRGIELVQSTTLDTPIYEPN